MTSQQSQTFTVAPTTLSLLVVIVVIGFLISVWGNWEATSNARKLATLGFCILFVALSWSSNILRVSNDTLTEYAFLLRRRSYKFRDVLRVTMEHEKSWIGRRAEIVLHFRNGERVTYVGGSSRAIKQFVDELARRIPDVVEPEVLSHAEKPY